MPIAPLTQPRRRSRDGAPRNDARLARRMALACRYSSHAAPQLRGRLVLPAEFLVQQPRHVHVHERLADLQARARRDLDTPLRQVECG
jgi:hypothetical protein